jgi:hypothetical protein
VAVRAYRRNDSVARFAGNRLMVLAGRDDNAFSEPASREMFDRHVFNNLSLGHKARRK